jgi:hypothetical protein
MAPTLLGIAFVCVLLFPWQLKPDSVALRFAYKAGLHLGWMLCLVWLMWRIWKMKTRIRWVVLPFGALAICLRMVAFFLLMEHHPPIKYHYCTLREYPDSPQHSIQMIHHHGFLGDWNEVHEIYRPSGFGLSFVRKLSSSTADGKLVLQSYPHRGDTVDCLRTTN